MITQAVILAGGLGTRLRPLTEKIPKPLVEVAGRPFLEWQLDYLKKQKIERVLLLVAYLGEQIQKHFGDGKKLGLEIDYSFEPEPLGTGGALGLAREKLDSTFFLLNGDSYLNAPLRKMEQAFSDFDLLVSAFDYSSPSPVPANLKLSGATAQSYQKGAGHSAGYTHVDSGVYVVRKSILADIPAGKFNLEDLYPNLIAKGKFGTFPLGEKFYDIGTPERIKEFETYLEGLR